MQKLAISK